MLDATPVLRLYARRRLAALAALDPAACQEATLRRLLARAVGTRFGKAHGFSGIAGVADFQARVPLRRYEDFRRDWWQEGFPRLVDATWPGLIPHFALSSGTTTGRTKHIPVTAAMRRANVKAALQLLCHHVAARPASRVFAGRTLMLGGSTALDPLADGVAAGDLSGIGAATAPAWTRPFLFPPPKLALMADWEEKVEVLARRSLDLPIRALSGTPSWLLILLDRVMALRRQAGVSDVPPWPEVDLHVHGGVDFRPYRRRFEAILDPARTDHREGYAASEGFIAVADRAPGEGMRLVLDHGIFFEFVPTEELSAAVPRRHWAATIQTGVDYAVVVTSCAGLWAYVLGDTVRFADTRPPRLLVTGRTALTLSAFGEHLILEEIEGAVAKAAAAIGADVSDFVVGPIHPQTPGALGRHVFIVELVAPPAAEGALARFAATLDAALMEANDDYRAHRSGGFGLAAPQVLVAPPGAFARWMKAHGKLGGQHKVPRIVIDAAILESVRALAVANT